MTSRPVQLLEAEPRSSIAQRHRFDYRPEIDGLRGVAIVLVLLFHSRLGFAGGYVGVDVFFVISGYLITGLILKEMSIGEFNLLAFWERRARRIIPAMAVMIILSLIVGGFILVPKDYGLMGESAIAHALMMANFYFRMDTGYFSASAEVKPLLHTWSLAVEEQFYLVLPFLLLFMQRLRSPITFALAILCAISFALSLYCTHHHQAIAFYLLPTRAWELLIGCVLAAVPRKLPAARWADEVVGWAGFACILAASVFLDSKTAFPGVAALLPCLGAGAIIWSNSAKRNSLGRLLATPSVVFVGLISYSLYLWHWPMLVYSQYWNDGPSSLLVRVTIIGCCFLLAILSWKFVETPFRRREWAPHRRTMFAVAGAAVMLLLAGGMVLYVGNGLRMRFAPEVLAYADGETDIAFRSEITLEGIRQERLVELGSDSRKPIKVLVWGDSHAMAIMPLMDVLCREHGVRGVGATHSATLPILGYKSIAPYALKEASIPFNAAVVDFLEKYHIPNVVIAAAWMHHTAEFTAQEKIEFENRLRETVQTLHAMGTTVWLMKQVPDHRFPVPRALTKAAIFGDAVNKIGIPLLEHRQRSAYTDAVLDDASHLGARVLDPLDYLVDETGLCRTAVGGKSLYWDSGHLTVHGAMQLRPLFAPIFEQ